MWDMFDYFREWPPVVVVIVLCLSITTCAVLERKEAAKVGIEREKTRQLLIKQQMQKESAVKIVEE